MIVIEEGLQLENEISILKRKLTLEKRKLEENQYLMGGGFKRAISLIGEARQVGLIDEAIEIDYQNFQEMYSVLQTAMNWVPNIRRFKMRLTILELISIMRESLLRKLLDTREKLNIRKCVLNRSDFLNN